MRFKASTWPIILLLLGSCATTKKPSRSIGSDEFSHIKNEDFALPASKSFDYSDDAYKQTGGSFDVLAEESLNRASAKRLKKFKPRKNPLSAALALCYRREFNRGLAILHKKYRQYKKYGRYWNNIGTCYLLKGNKRKAMLYYNKAREVAKKYAPPVNNLGVIYEGEQKYQKALMSYNLAADLGRFSLTPLYNKGRLYLQYSLGEKAEPIFDSLNQKMPKDVDMANALAISRLMAGNIPAALKIFATIDKRHWQRADIGLNYAVALKKAGEGDRANKVFGRVKRIRKEEQNYYEKVKNYVLQ